MSIAYVRDTGMVRTSGASQSSSASFGTAPAVGNCVVAGGTSWFAGQANGAQTFSDNKGNSYTTDNQGGCGGGGGTGLDQVAAVGQTIVATSGGTFTVTMDAAGTTNTYYTWMAVEFSEIASSPFDKTDADQQDGSAATVTTGPTATLSQADELIVTALAVYTGLNHTALSASGYTTLFQEPDGTTWIVGGLAYQIVSATTGVSAVWSWTSSPSVGSGAVILTYKAGSAAEPPLNASFRNPTNRPSAYRPGIAR